MAVGFLDGKVGFAQFDEERAHAPDLIALAEKISYVIDPDNPYPNRYTGRVSVTLKDGRVVEKSRPNFRGGAHLPLSDDELTQKYRDNCRYGGWDAQLTATVEQAVAQVAAGGKVDFSASRA
jgi:2-methylcitrate dehydratase PrpD